MTDTVDSGTSNTYQNDNPRRLSLSSSAFSNYTVGSTEYGYWWVHELSRTAGSTANGNTPLSSYDTTGTPTPSTTPTTPATTPFGTTRQRDLRLQPCRTPRAPEPTHPQHQELNTVF